MPWPAALTLFQHLSEPSTLLRITFAFSLAQSLLLLPIIQHFDPFSSSSSVQSSKILLESRFLSYVHKPVSCNTSVCNGYTCVGVSLTAAHKIIQFFLISILIFHWVTPLPSLNTIVPEKNPRVQKFDPGKTAISGALYPAYLEHVL